jgi:hypothetical protein
MPGVPFLDVDVAGHQAYVAAGGWGLRVIDVSTPAAPQEVGAYIPPGDSNGYANGVQVIGQYAYVTYDHFVHPGRFGSPTADDNTVLRVIDVSDPTVPAEAGSYATVGSAIGVHVAGSYIYAAYDNAGRVGGLLVLRFTGAVAATATPSATHAVSPTTTPTATVTLTPIFTPTATVTPIAATATPELAQRAVYLPYVTRSSGSD